MSLLVALHGFLTAYADGRLYFRDAKTLRCVQLLP